MTTSPLLVGATLAAAADPARVDAVVLEAAVGGQPVVDALLDRAGVDESAFLSSLAAQLQWPWLLTVNPDADEAAQLKKACPTRLALRHRLIPLSFEKPGDQAEGAEGEPAANGHTAIDIACYDPFDLQARQAAARVVPIPGSMAPRRRAPRCCAPSRNSTAWGPTPSRIS